jgi:flagellar basal-body rod protein FlgF
VNLGLYSGVAAARSSERRLEAITSNLANLETPAFKRVSTGVRAFQLPSGKPDDLALHTQASTDFSQGELELSSSPYHLALRGAGFFTVDGPEGELLTRNGAFRVDDTGELLTQEGHPVAWSGPHAPIDGTGEPVTVDGAGTIRQGTKDIGRLRLVDFVDPGQLEKLGGGYYVAAPALEELPSDADVRQGALERSNVSGVDEMVAMVSIQRNFESAQSVMRLIDQSYARLTSAR